MIHRIGTSSVKDTMPAVAKFFLRKLINLEENKDLYMERKDSANIVYRFLKEQKSGLNVMMKMFTRYNLIVFLTIL